MNRITIEQKINEMAEICCDVLVVGGGTAGVFAAISASLTGADTLLIEKNQMLGGTLTYAGVNFPGLFFAWGKQIISGPCYDAVLETARLGGAKIPDYTAQKQSHDENQILINKHIYTYVIHKMCTDSGARVICNSMISYIEETSDGVFAIITDKSGMKKIKAKTLIDATGDANCAQLLGYPLMTRQTVQPASLQNHISGYNPDDVDIEEIRVKLSKVKLPFDVTAENIMFYLKIHKINTSSVCHDASTSEGKTELDFRAVNELMDFYMFMRSVKGLEKLNVDYMAAETGVRESNRIIGISTVTARDYLNGKFYEDSVCYSFYPIDVHVENRIDNINLKRDVVPKIPYSALIPKESKKIICAGRCISSDVFANSALRVEASCMAMGQVCGCAASVASSDNSDFKNVPYNKLCDLLESVGAIVPKK